METLDIWLFYAINHGLSNELFDTVMPVLTSSRLWLPCYIAGILLLLWRGGTRGRWCAATLLVSIALTDPLSTHLLKETIQRIRPYEALGDVIKLVGSGGGSFPSNHALNNASAAMILSSYYRRYTWLWWTIAGIIGFTRVYCGVHYPSDVVGGLAIGTLAGYGLSKLSGRFAKF
ncbi:MAG: phosphatase PAP2 family protein [Candidatus Kapabacteria bacterium]|nr:phosphatase PAP2 family protein [Candidatus Kapabacteria bacterium]